MFEEKKETSKNEPEDIFAEAKIEEEKIEKTEPLSPTIPKEFIRKKRGFPKIFIPIIVLLILFGLGFFLNSAGILRFEKKEKPLVNQPLIKSPEPPANPSLEILDSDNDGLTDDEEVTLGTNPHLVDSDNDGLPDKEEVKIYQTDPLNPDTDGDSYKDGEEVYAGYNPKDPSPKAKLFDLSSEIEKIKE